MGMFDEIIPEKNNPIKCPKCKKVCASFQTKDLENLMDCYVEFTTERTEPVLKLLKGKDRTGFPLFKKTKEVRHYNHPVYHQVYAYEYCDKCKKFVGQYFRFDESGLLTRWGKTFLET